MTEQEKKANELIKLFSDIESKKTRWHDATDFSQAKQCAIIHVNGIIEVSCFVDKKCAEKQGFSPETTEEFWQEVRTILSNM